jgi:hypothetical protein
MAVILISGTEKLDGRDLNSFYAYLRDVAQKLGLEEQSVIETFEAKTADLISLQNHIEETVLLVFAVGAILSTIRALKQETLLFSIRSAVKDRFEGKWSVQDDVELTKELDFLFQTSDSDLSLLLNLGVLAEMAHCLKLRLSIVNFEEYVERITHRLISKARNDPTNQIDPADQ